ncbi:hypothetical protein M472_11545 [Sphingobacterium paucimobilis HER1398]|uniref:Uncharacterized protein n=1 Tax=Sphingobacterium paucimobilis HER1398 TaxID=1346330 RepID=U2J9R3_9SPHI|nr:hypothetical protein M472_11545 [Sphingobacterium paucimobilis HER1398]
MYTPKNGITMEPVLLINITIESIHASLDNPLNESVYARNIFTWLFLINKSQSHSYPPKSTKIYALHLLSNRKGKNKGLNH